MVLKDIQQKIYDILEEPTGLDTKIVNVSLTLLIGLNVMAVVLETVEPLYQHYYSWFLRFEQFSIAIFTAEYILRVWVCTLDPVHGKERRRRLKYMLSAGAIIDLLVILPFFLPLITTDLRMARMVRFFRIFRVFKLGRYTKSARMLSRTIRAKKEALLVTLMTALMILLIAAGAIYYTEHDAQPELFSSIPSSMWYAVVTLTTVGYGDAYPVTPLGKFLGSVLAFVGIGLFALPTGILASGLAEELSKDCDGVKQGERCPHCGKELN